VAENRKFLRGIDSKIHKMSPPCDNFLFVPRKNFRFLENRVRFFFAKTSKENRHEKGFYHVEQKRD